MVKQTQNGQPAVYNATPPTFADGEAGALQFDANGNLKTTGGGGGGGGASTVANGADVNGGSTTDSNLVPNITTPGTTTQGTISSKLRYMVSALAQLIGVASGSADSGNPIKAGGRYNSTQPTLTDGQRGDLQLDTKSNLKIILMDPTTQNSILGGADNSDGLATGGSPNGGIKVLARALVFNGSTMDRLRGSAAAGVFSNVTATPTVSTVSVATTSTSVLAANTSRKKLILSNVGANDIWINMAGGTAVNTNVLLAPGQTLIDDEWVSQAAITAIAATGATNLSVTEYA